MDNAREAMTEEDHEAVDVIKAAIQGQETMDMPKDESPLKSDSYANDANPLGE